MRLLVASTLTTCWMCAGARGAQPADWLSRIRTDHPRLFLSRDTRPAVKARALGPEREYYDKMKKRVDGYPADPKGDSGGAAYDKDERVGGKVYKMASAKPAKEWGIQAMQTAFVYLVTGDKAYLEKARKMLEVSVAVYNECYAQRRAVNWYSTSRVSWLAAYDWLFNDLTPEQRKALIVPMLQHVDDVQPGAGKPPIHRRNGSSYTTGFYGVTNIVWFAGLAAHGDGHADDMARRFLLKGHELNRKLFEHRARTAGDDGGLASPTVGYALAAYPWSQFNFLHTWRSATGENLAPRWPHLGYFPVWIMWSWIPTDGRPKEFGAGDTPHYDNNLPWWEIGGHMRQIMHFYGQSHPQEAAVAAYVRERCSLKQFTGNWSVYPFLMTDIGRAPAPSDPGAATLHGRHFEQMGQIIMRSGWGPEDTYCMLTLGSSLSQHKHYDEGNFIIYRKGFLALDSGTRGTSKDFNLRHYYAQTVAHNCVLIHMPEEPLPSYWGPKQDAPEGRFCHGGMNKQTGSVVKAFETNSHYTYAAGDLTPCYSDKKCALALRQLVYLLPDTFVVCDRVVSTDPAYRKEWLLHTHDEPEIDGTLCSAGQGGGRLFCRTLLPAQAQLTKVGGPGKEFWANGVNWELNDAVKARDARQREKTGSGMLWGNWRVEVSPGEARTDDVFLHVLHGADVAAEAMPPAELLEDGDRVGAEIRFGRKVCRIWFGADGEPSGHVRITSAENVVLDQPLTQAVQAQSGVGVGE